MPLRPLLISPDRKPIELLNAWRESASRIRSTFLRTLGVRPESQRLHDYRVGQAIVDRGVVRRLVTIRVDEDDVMEAWLLEPESADANLPGRGRVALALHPTSDEGKDEVAGVDPAKHPHRAYGRELALRGWIVLCPDHNGVQRRWSRGLRNYDTARLYERFPNWSMVGKMLADEQICLDVLDQLPQTRGKEVAAIGHSLGGHGSVWIGAIDPRVTSVVCNCGATPFLSDKGNWFRDAWAIYFPKGELRTSVERGAPLWDFHEVMALIAPRRFLLTMATNDYCGGSVESFTEMTSELHRVWPLTGGAGNLTCTLHNEGHVFERWHREFAYAWMENERSDEAIKLLGDIQSKQMHKPSSDRY